MTLPVHRPARVPVRIDRSEQPSPPLRPLLVLPKPALLPRVRQPLPDRPTHHRRGHRRGQRPVRLEVRPGGTEVLLPHRIGRGPHNAQRLQILGPLRQQGPRPHRPTLIGQPPPQRKPTPTPAIRTFNVVVRHREIPLPLPIRHGRPMPRPPGRMLRLDQVVPHQPRHQNRIPAHPEPEQQPLLLLVVTLGCLTDPRRRPFRPRRVLLRDSKHFHGTFIMSTQPRKNFQQRAIRSRIRHVFRSFILTKKNRHDQCRHLALPRLLPKGPPNGLDDIHRRAFRIDQGYGIHARAIDPFTQDPAIRHHRTAYHPPNRCNSSARISGSCSPDSHPDHTRSG